MTTVQPGYNVSLRVTGTPISMTGQTLVDTGDGLRWEVPDSQIARTLWDWTTPPTVYVDGTPVSADTYEVEYLVGAIIFDADQSGSTVTVDADYLPSYLVDLGRAEDQQDGYNALDATRHFDTAERYVLGQRTTEISITRLRDVDPIPLDGTGGTEKTLEQIIDDGDAVVVEFGPGGTDTATKAGSREGPLLRTLAKLHGRSHTAETGSIQESELTAEPVAPAADQIGRPINPIQQREIS